MSGIKAGEIDIVDSVVDSEYKIRYLTKLVYLLLTRLKSSSVNNPITQAEIDKLLKEAENELIAKYPNSGIHRKK